MIAQQPHRLEARHGVLQKSLDDFAAGGAAIDIIAEEDQAAAGILAMTRRVGGDAPEKHLEQVGAAMDVAHRVDRMASRDRGRLSRRIRPLEPP